MSLKFFHVFFIVVSTVMALGVGVWAVNAWQANGAAQWVVLAAIAFVSGAGLIAYGNRFLQKARKLGIAGLLAAGSLAWPREALACPACVGNTDSILQSGVNNGIFVLLGIIGFMWVGFASFFVYLYLTRRAHVASTSVRSSAVATAEGSI